MLAAVIPATGTQVVRTVREPGVIHASPGVVRFGFDPPPPSFDAQVTALWVYAVADAGVQVESLALEGGGRTDVARDALDASGSVSIRVAIDAPPWFEPDTRLWITCRFAAGGIRRISFGAAGIQVIRRI